MYPYIQSISKQNNILKSLHFGWGIVKQNGFRTLDLYSPDQKYVRSFQVYSDIYFTEKIMEDHILLITNDMNIRLISFHLRDLQVIS